MWAVLSLAMMQGLAPVLVTDPDAWWHIATARWILEHTVLPYTDPFSVFGANRAWQVSSWIFDLLLYALYKLSGPRGFVLFTTVLWMSIAATLYTLVRRKSQPATAAVLTGFMLVAAESLATPRPWLFSILFFAVELFLLCSRFRWALPFLFALWANLHIEFVYGVAALLLAAVCRAVDWRIAAASALATLANPYGIDLWRLILEYSSHFGLSAYVTELRPPAWRAPATVLLGGGFVVAVLMLIRSRMRAVFPYALLVFAAALSFRSRRDLWVLVIAIVYTAASQFESRRSTEWRPLAVGASCAVIMLAMLWARRVPAAEVERELRQTMPVQTTAVAMTRHPRTVFSTFDWGGYLIWNLPPAKVFIDGRTNVHGKERTARNFATWRAENWESDPDLAAADVVIAPRQTPLTNALTASPEFTVLFGDAVSVLFERRLRRTADTASIPSRTEGPTDTGGTGGK